MEQKPTILLIDVKGIEILSTHHTNKNLGKKKNQEASRTSSSSIKINLYILNQYSLNIYSKNSYDSCRLYVFASLFKASFAFLKYCL
jgi:hypothetical protein